VRACLQALHKLAAARQLLSSVRGRSAVGGSTDSEGGGDDVMGGRDRESRFVGLF